jgi:HSP90 family molecular chaperone
MAKTTGAISIDWAGFLGLMESLFEMRHVHIRELVQNALESVNLAKQSSPLVGNIRIETEPKSRSIRLTDNGVGMDLEALTQRLPVVFKSGWKDGGFPTLGIGQFGFGFFSVFLVATRVRITARPRAEPEACRTVSFNCRTGQYSIRDVAANVLPEPGVAVELTLKPEHAYGLDDDFIKGELTEVYLHSDCQIHVNGSRVAIPTKAQWSRSLDAVRGASSAAHWLQERFGWSDNPMHVFPFSHGDGGWLAVVPEYATAPALKVFRRGVRVTEDEVIRPPLNYFITGIVDLPEVNLKPDRESLRRDTVYTKLANALTACIDGEFRRLADREKTTLRSICRSHSEHVLLSIVSGRLLDPSIALQYPFRTITPSGETGEITIGQILEDQPSSQIVWHSGSKGERLLSEKLNDAGIKSLLLTNAKENRLAQFVCENRGIRLRRVQEVFVDRVNLSSPENRFAACFQNLLGQSWSILYYSDQDTRLPAVALRRSPAGEDDDDIRRALSSVSSRGERDGAGELHNILLLNTFAPVAIEINRRLADNDGGERARVLATTVLLSARMMAGDDIGAMEMSHLVNTLIETIQRQEQIK